jgi:P4 family phage/plasmid primase-like protien
VVAVDIDVRDPKLAARLRNMAVKRFGRAPERVGAAPKVALLYRVKGKPFSKIHTNDFELPGDEPGDKAHKVEILAAGQQIVCYHIHPDTGKPYRWNGAGEPLTVPVAKLPRVTREQCVEFIAKCETLLAKAGEPRGGNLKHAVDNDPRIDKEVGGELRASDPELLRKALRVIPNADESWDEWIKKCLAIKGALGAAGHDDWMRWSALSSKHDEAESEEAWRTAKPARIGAGSIFNWAKAHGFKFPAKAPRMTEGGLAERFADQYVDDVRYDSEEEGWYVWNGTLWVPQPGRAPAVQEYVKETIKGIITDANEVKDEDRRKAMRQWAIKSDCKHVIRGAMDLASSDPRLRVTMAELDRDPYLLGTQSGVINLRTGKPIKSDRRHMVTRSVPTLLDPTATCPRWEKFISEVMLEDQEMVAFMQRFVGYVLIGGNPERLIFFLYGVGRNGKTVFIETVLRLMGDYGGPAKSDMLMKHRADRDSESAQPFMLKLRGLRYISATEVEAGKHLDARVVKDLTGQDEITVRGLHTAPARFTVEGKIVVRCNHRPIIDGVDQAIWDRIVEVPFDLRLEKEDEDTGLRGALNAELPGILNWALDGCRGYLKYGMQLPDKVKKQTAAYREAMDTFAQWFKERVTTKSPRARTRPGVVYIDYQKWCAEASTPSAPPLPVMSSRDFKVKLSDRGFIRKKVQGDPHWCGIELVKDAQ